MPLPPGVAVTKAVGEPEIPDLRARSRRGRRDRRLPVGRPAVLLVGQHAAFPILFDRLDLEVFEDVHSAAGAKLKGEAANERRGEFEVKVRGDNIFHSGATILKGRS